MRHKIIVGLAAEDIKAVLVGHPLSFPGYGSTINAAVGELIIKNFELFDVEIREGDPFEAMRAKRTDGKTWDPVNREPLGDGRIEPGPEHLT